MCNIRVMLLQPWQGCVKCAGHKDKDSTSECNAGDAPKEAAHLHIVMETDKQAISIRENAC